MRSDVRETIYEPLVVPGVSLGRIDRVKFLLERCSGRRVLHVGCTDWPITAARLASGNLLHSHLRDVAGELWGLDVSEEGVHCVRQAGFENIILGDVEAARGALGEKRFDIVVAGEVLEHVFNAQKALVEMGHMLEDHGELILSVPNAFCLPLQARFLLGEEKVHSDHCYYFSPKTIVRLCSAAGLEVCELGFAARVSQGTLQDAVVSLLEKAVPRVCGSVIAVGRKKSVEGTTKRNAPGVVVVR